MNLQTYDGFTPLMLATCYDKTSIAKLILENKSCNVNICNKAGSTALTYVAENGNHFLIVGEGTTSFTNISSNSIAINSSNNEFTVALLPNAEGTTPSSQLISDILNPIEHFILA